MHLFCFSIYNPKKWPFKSETPLTATSVCSKLQVILKLGWKRVAWFSSFTFIPKSLEGKPFVTGINQLQNLCRKSVLCGQLQLPSLFVTSQGQALMGLYWDRHRGREEKVNPRVKESFHFIQRAHTHTAGPLVEFPEPSSSPGILSPNPHSCYIA